MESSIVIAAIAACAPTLTAIATHLLARKSIGRVEQNTNGELARLRAELAAERERRPA